MFKLMSKRKNMEKLALEVVACDKEARQQLARVKGLTTCMCYQTST